MTQQPEASKINMRKFVVRIADVNIEINTLSTGTYGYCIDYLTSDKQDIDISITKEDVDQLIKADQRASQFINEAYLESIAVYQKIVEEMLSYKCFMMHGAVVAIDNAAWMFSAKSKTGKTTHVKKWLKHINGAYIVNGDKPLIKIQHDQVYACGTPWCGKERLGRNTMVPLKAVVFLERSESNSIQKLTFSNSFLYLLQHVYIPSNPEKAKETLQLLQMLEDKVSFYYHIKLY